MAAPPTASSAASPLLHRPRLRLRRSLRPPLRLPPTSSCTSSSRRPSAFQKSQFRSIASRPARRCVPIQIATAFDEDQGDFSLVHDDGDEAFGENDAPPIRPRLLLPTLRCRLLLPTPPPTPGYALRHSSPAPPIRPRLLLPTPPPPPDTVLPGEPLRRSSSPPSSHCRSPCCTVLPSRSRSRTPGGGTRCPRSPDPRTTAPKATICEDLKLERVLQKASMGDNTVILTTLNAAWASPGSVLNLFMDSFRSGVRTSSLLKHLVIIAFDWTAYKQCVKIHPYCFALGTEGVDFSEEKRFLTSGYLEMMWKRLDFLRLVLEKGYSFVFSDADIMWFRNPFPHFYPDGDFQIACDHYVGNSTDLRNIANGGFNYVKSNERSIEFYSFWYSSRLRYPGYHDQDVFNVIKHDPYVADIGLTIKFLSTAYFGGFCEPSRDLNKVCTMHANCCIGLRSKLHDLRIMMEDWRSYLSLPPSLKRLRTLAWRVPQNCSLSLLN